VHDEDPVIELEPKRGSPFQWPVFLSLIAAWVVILVLAVQLKSNLLRMLWPVLLLILLVYLAVCTFTILRSRK
jgi:hypothetical protein